MVVLVCGCKYYQLYLARSRDLWLLDVIGKNWSSSHLQKSAILRIIFQSLAFDHGFECCGGDGTGPAINDLIRYIRPQGNDSS